MIKTPNTPKSVGVDMSFKENTFWEKNNVDCCVCVLPFLSISALSKDASVANDYRSTQSQRYCARNTQPNNTPAAPTILKMPQDQHYRYPRQLRKKILLVCCAAVPRKDRPSPIETVKTIWPNKTSDKRRCSLVISAGANCNKSGAVVF